MNFRYFSEVLATGLPTWTVIQNWILRFGLYKLLKPLSKRKDWIWIIDHTIEFGTKKCLVVLAVSYDTLLKKKHLLSHKDMEIAAINIESKVSGKQVATILSQVKEELGEPIQIVSDNDRVLKNAVSILRESCQSTFHSYDITHKAAIEVKYLLQNNQRWQQFVKNIGDTKRLVQQSVFAFLAPRKPRDKSRWQNLDQHLNWAGNILEYKKKGMVKKGRPSKKDIENKMKFNSCFGWIDGFKQEIELWSGFLNVLDIAQHEVKTYGLSKCTAEKFDKRTRNIAAGNNRVDQLKNKMSDFFFIETKEFEDNQNLLGTSDIIESIFGKYKTFSAKTPLKEIGKSVLTIPILTSAITFHEVYEAMETISNKKLMEWLNKNVGESLFAKRKKAFKFLKTKNKVK